MRDNPLFRDRVPEAAAQQLATVLAQAAEWALATVEALEMRNRPLNSDLVRHRSIAKALVSHCAELAVDPNFGLYGPCPRLARAVAALRARGG